MSLDLSCHTFTNMTSKMILPNIMHDLGLLASRLNTIIIVSCVSWPDLVLHMGDYMVLGALLMSHSI